MKWFRRITDAFELIVLVGSVLVAVTLAVVAIGMIVALETGASDAHEPFIRTLINCLK